MQCVMKMTRDEYVVVATSLLLRSGFSIFTTSFEYLVMPCLILFGNVSTHTVLLPHLSILCCPALLFGNVSTRIVSLPHCSFMRLQKIF